MLFLLQGNTYISETPVQYPKEFTIQMIWSYMVYVDTDIM